VQIITLGIGPDSDIEHLVLTGLRAGDAPPPPVIPPTSGTITPGAPVVLTENFIYTLPPGLVSITKIDTSGGTIQFSLDSVTWESATLDTNKNFITSAIFIRSVAHNSTIIAKVFPL
jgi:hypothetical protein